MTDTQERVTMAFMAWCYTIALIVTYISLVNERGEFSVGFNLTRRRAILAFVIIALGWLEFTRIYVEAGGLGG